VNHWPFILAAYGIGLVATVALVVASYLSMRKAEAEADTLKDRR
jgi:heme exporter protein D